MKEEQVTINYPAKASQFLALIEQWDDGSAERASLWTVSSQPTCIVFVCAEKIFGTHSGNMRLYYERGRAPVVIGEAIEFPLNELFEKGKPWDPDVYRNNPYMPPQHKRFLDGLFALFAALGRPYLVPFDPNTAVPPWQAGEQQA
ncbi:hypothetical protein [Thioalkalivibrio sulfidiphilus]|uniref:hypothetical protein n=1 Tax=Thioalkalivibrio sulfidiphilus TaxID=1033854 RepID=UPI003B2EFD94